MRGEVHESRDETRDFRAHRIHQVFAYQAAGVCQPLGELARARVEQQASRLAGAGSEHHNFAARLHFPARFLVYVGNTVGKALCIHQHLARHGVTTNFEVSRCEGRRKKHCRR